MHYEFKVNDEPWTVFGEKHATLLDCDELTKEHMLVDCLSWADCLAHLEENAISYVQIDKTLFRRRPYIEFHRVWSEEEHRFYEEDVKEISIRAVCVYDSTYTLAWVLKHAPAEKAIEYMKQRGMNICPLQ